MNHYRRHQPPAFTMQDIAEEILFIGMTYSVIVLAAYWFVGAL